MQDLLLSGEGARQPYVYRINIKIKAAIVIVIETQQIEKKGLQLMNAVKP